MNITGVAFAVLITGGLLAFQFIKGRRYKETHRPSALDAFNTLSVPSSNARFQFQGKSAQIMDEKEVIEQIRGTFLAYTLTRIARNGAGEYFWFYFRTDSPPQLKHIDQPRAKALLKGKYIAADA
ncbi:MAG: hypothetical protein KA535_06090 [Azonexus sp.]|nr:hypothetical protein [Azonexus sp.]